MSLPKLLQTWGIKCREAGQPISGRALNHRFGFLRELNHGAKSSTNRSEILGKRGIQPLRHNRRLRANLADLEMAILERDNPGHQCLGSLKLASGEWLQFVEASYNCIDRAETFPT